MEDNTHVIPERKEMERGNLNIIKIACLPADALSLNMSSRARCLPAFGGKDPDF
jgi:hypothetical protein